MTEASERKTAFTDEQYAALYPEGMENHYWYVARNAMVLDAIAAIERQHGQCIDPMLEIGCGQGIVVEFLRRSGRDCYGSELAPIPVPEPLEQYIWSGTDFLTLPRDFRDKVKLILLLDVIEHIEDPVDFLAKIRGAFSGCRWLVITVPARMELWSKFDELYGHFRRYDDAMLRDEINKAGGDLVTWRYRFTLLYLAIYVLGRFGRTRKLNNHTPTFPNLHRVLGKLIERETWVLPRWVYGSSIVAVARFFDRSA